MPETSQAKFRHILSHILRKMVLYHLTLIVESISSAMTAMAELFGLLYQAKSFKDCSLPGSDLEVK